MFVERLGDIAAANGWAFAKPRVDIELDESVHPRAYRLDLVFREAAPGQEKLVTTLFDPEPEAATPPPAPPRPRQRLNSEWELRLPDGRRHVVPLDATITIGSSADCDVVLASKYVSRVNTTVTAQGANLLVRDGDPRSDRRSANGTKVDGHRVTVFTLTPRVGAATLVLGGDTTIGIALRTAHPRTHAAKGSGS